MARVDTKEMRLWAADIEERVPLTCKQLIRSAADELDELRKYQRRDLYSELAKALGSDEMDSHEGRLCRAKELAETRALTRERDEAVIRAHDSARRSEAKDVLIGELRDQRDEAVRALEVEQHRRASVSETWIRREKILVDALEWYSNTRPDGYGDKARKALDAIREGGKAPECTCLAGDDGHDLDLNCPKHGREGGGA